jgi:hypothetical protein
LGTPTNSGVEAVFSCGGDKMNKLIDRGINTALFKMKWAFMSQRKRYAYLWRQTKYGELKKSERYN